MIDPATGQELPDFITPQAPISPLVPGAGPAIIPPVNHYQTASLTAPIPVTPDSLITAPLPSTTGGVLPPPTPIGDVGPVPGLASTQPVAPPAAMTPLALPAGGSEPGTAIPATAHTPAFAGPATSTPPVNDQSVEDVQKASSEVQQATQDLGAAQAQAAADEAAAREHQVEQDQLNIDRHRETARQVQEDIQRINDHQRSAVEEAHKTTIPDFWEGREGAHALGAISMALGTAGQALTAFGTGVNVGNTAKDLIDANIRTYMARKKEEVDNLWKYADRMGQLGQQEKADLGQKLVNLQYETAAMHQSAADEIMAQATAAKGRVAIPQAMELAKQQALTGAQLANEARQKNAQLQLEKRRVGIEGYAAATARMKALDDRNHELTIKMEDRIGKRMDAAGRELIGTNVQPGAVAKLAKVEEVKNNLRAARESGDPSAMAAALLGFKESVGPLLAGGKTTANLTHQIDELGTTKDEITKKIGKLTGSNPVGDTVYKRVYGMLDQVSTEEAGHASGIRQRYVNEHLGPGGTANTPELKQYFLNRLNGLTSDATLNGQPIFKESEGAAGATPQQAGGSEAQQAQAWVAAHPTDPRVAAIKQRYGF